MEGEDHGLRDYKTEDDLETRVLLETQLRPAQQKTHDLLSALKHRM